MEEMQNVVCDVALRLQCIMQENSLEAREEVAAATKRKGKGSE